jgi:phosphoglycolate phosphatase
LKHLTVGEIAMRFRAVLFDLDGTLLDTLDDLADSMNASLRRFGFPPHAEDTYRYLVGDGLVNLNCPP